MMDQIKEDLISIIIPTYNRAGCIDKTIQSVLNQHNKFFELIIIDDGSIDNTEQVVSLFRDQRIKYFKKHNGERGAARNFGVDKAKGGYITFLDSDDVLEEDHLSIALSYIQKEQHHIFHLGYNVVDDDHKVIYPWKKLPSPCNEKLIEGNFLSCLGIFIRRDIALQYPFNEDRDLAGSEDYELWLRLAARYDIYTYDSVSAKLVNHETRSVLSFDVKKLTKRIELLWQYLMRDDLFISAYKKDLNKLSALLNIYLALHLVLSKASKSLIVKIMLRSIFKFPAIILYKRFWVVVKKILF